MPFVDVRAAARRTVARFAAVVAAYVPASVYVSHVAGVVAPLSDVTGGLVTRPLVTGAGGLAVVLGVVLRDGNLAQRDLGLRRDVLPTAAVLTVLLWLWTVAAGLGVGLATGRLAVHPGLRTRPGLVVGAWLGFTLGSGLFEEVGFRGFLLPQAYHRLDARNLFQTARGRLFAAAAVSQGFFAVLHVPILFVQFGGVAGVVRGLPLVFGVALLLAAVYVRTRNVFLAVGIHGLWDFTPRLFAVPGFGRTPVLLAGVVAVLVAWPRLRAASLVG